MISEKSIRRAVERFQLFDPGGVASSADRNIQVVLDASASMGSGDGSKEQRARELAMILLRLAVIANRPITLWAARGAERTRTIDTRQPDRLAQFPFDGTVDLLQSWPTSLPACGIRVVLSDFLFESDASQLIQQASGGAFTTFLIQLLDPWEQDPQPAGRMKFVDIETEGTLELSLDSGSIDRYLVRLSSLQQRLSDACAAGGAVWISLNTAAELEQICEDNLVPGGLLAELPVEK